MNYTGSLCPNCKRPLAPGERICKYCGEYRVQGDANAGSIFPPYPSRTGVSIQDRPIQRSVIENPGEKVADFHKSFPRPKKWKILVVIGSALAIIFLLMAGSFALGRYSVTSENKLARVNPLTTAPTATPKSAQPVPSGVINRDTLLRCDCDDPIRVTVTKITVDQTNGGKMIWSMTIHNDSGSFLYYSAHFYLEDQQGRTFIGTGLQQSSNFSAGKSVQVDVTFALAPVREVPYTLDGVLVIGGDYLQVNFDPAPFIF